MLSNQFVNNSFNNNNSSNMTTTELPQNIDQWEKKSKLGKLTGHELSNYFILRSHLEEEYASKLQKLSLETFGNAEIGGLNKTLQSLTQEINTTSGVHLKLSEQLKNELKLPLEDFLSQQKSQRKEIIQILTKLSQDKSASQANLNRARARVEEIPKFSDDPRRYLVDQEYHACVQLYQEAAYRCDTESRLASSKYEAIEENRIQFLRSTLWKYVNMMSSSCVSDDEALERVRQSLEILDPRSDVEIFMKESINDKAVIENGLENSKHRMYPTPSHSEENQLSLPNHSGINTGSPLKNEIQSSNNSSEGPKLTQILSSLQHTQARPRGAALPTNDISANMSIPISLGRPIPSSVHDPNKIISNDLVTATIARSPILAAKRSSTSGSRPSSIPPTPVSVPISAAAAPPMPHPAQQMPPSAQFPHGPSRTPSVAHGYPPRGSRPSSPEPNPQFGNPYHPGHRMPQYHPSVGPGSPHHPRTPMNRPIGQSQQQPPAQQQPHQGRPMGPGPARAASPPPHHSMMGHVSPPTDIKMENNPSPSNSNKDPRPILFYVRAIYDYDPEIPEEIALREGQMVAVLATQLDGWWEGQVISEQGTASRVGIFPSNFTEPASL